MQIRLSQGARVPGPLLGALIRVFSTHDTFGTTTASDAYFDSSNIYSRIGGGSFS